MTERKAHNTQTKIEIVIKEKWEDEVMHTQYIRSIDRQLNSEKDTFIWPSRGDMTAETEIIAAQDKTLQIKYHETKILHTEM
jgi:hypothetical protein